MRIRWLLLGTAFAMVVLAVAAVACSNDDEDGGGEATATQPAGEATTVEVKLTEYIVSPKPEAVPAGSVTFNASNIGGEEHQLYVIRTDLAPDALPAADDGSVDEAGEGIEVLDEIEELAAQTEASLTIDLSAGNYVLICNIVTAEGTSHYQEGMYTSFEVTE